MSLFFIFNISFANNITVLGTEDGAIEIDSPSEIKEMTFKEAALKKLRLAHKRGEFLDVKESDILQLSEEQLMKLANIEDENEERKFSWSDYVEAQPDEDTKNDYIVKNEENNSVLNAAKKNKELLAFLGFASIGATYPIFGIKGRWRYNKEDLVDFFNGKRGVIEFLNKFDEIEKNDKIEENDEIALYEADEEIIKKDEKLVSDVVNKLTSTEGFCLPKKHENFTVKITNEEVNNAFCCYGNVILVSTDFLDNINHNENLLAATLAHEIGHGVKEHGLKNEIMKKENKENELRSVRWSEQDADSYGFHLLVNAGYNPSSQSCLFNKLLSNQLEVEESNRQTGTESDHPPIKERINTSLRRVEAYSNNRVSISDSNVKLDNKEVFSGDTESCYMKGGELAVKCHDGLI